MADGDFNRRKVYYWLAYAPAASNAGLKPVLAGRTGDDATDFTIKFSFSSAYASADHARPDTSVAAATLAENSAVSDSIGATILAGAGATGKGTLTAEICKDLYESFLAKHLPDPAA